jgi:hypothetical protein
MISAETITEMSGEGMKESREEGEFKYDDLICCKYLCKCYNVPPPSTIIIKT